MSSQTEQHKNCAELNCELTRLRYERVLKRNPIVVGDEDVGDPAF